MLTQMQADELMALVKELVNKASINFPNSGTASQLEVKSEDGQESFLIDVNRKGKIKISKCTYQERYALVEILLRLDLGGPTHENPDGTSVPCPHLHVYREGYADKWAFPLSADKFTDTTDLVKMLQEFLEYCNVKDVPAINPALY